MANRSAAGAIVALPGKQRPWQACGRVGHAAVVALVNLVLASAIVRLPILLVWNASASSPIGLYALAPWRAAERGDMAVAWPAPAARELAAVRRYLPRNVPLVKQVSAVEGDRVCARGKMISVNGRPLARRATHDPAGRRLPWWSGCRRLEPGELFLLSPHQPLAFDGRYFGITQAWRVLGRATLAWPA